MHLVDNLKYSLKSMEEIMRKLLFGIFSAFFCLSVSAQSIDLQQQYVNDSVGSAPSKEKRTFFDSGQVFPIFLMCVNPKQIQHPCFDPQLPAFWFGGLTPHDGIMGGKVEGLPLKDGFLRQNEGGLTLLQLSKGLISNSFGMTTAFQIGMGCIDLNKDYEMVREDGRVGVVVAKETLISSTIQYSFLRIPVLVGFQNRKHWFSLLSGVSLNFNVPGLDLYHYRHQDEDKDRNCRIHANIFSVNWQVMAGVGPVTISYMHSLSPIFKMTDGTGVYTSSLSIGLDLWYLLRRNGH